MKKQINTPLLYTLGLFLLLFCSCDRTPKFTAKGVVTGADGQTLYLEHVGVGSVETLDSINLVPGGKFEFKVISPKYPDFYRLRMKNQLINFAVDSTETITFNADAGTFATSYAVEG